MNWKTTKAQESTTKWKHGVYGSILETQYAIGLECRLTIRRYTASLEAIKPPCPSQRERMMNDYLERLQIAWDLADLPPEPTSASGQVIFTQPAGGEDE